MGRRKENREYCCPRCGYKTLYSTSMKQHLYKRTRTCPITINNIVLTEEIKQSIIANRVYDVDSIVSHSTNNITNNITTNIIVTNNNNNTNFNQIIANLDNVDKITRYVQHKNMYLIPLEDFISSKFETAKESYTKEDLYKMVDDVTESTNVSELNVVYHEDKQQLQIYDKDDENHCQKTWFEKDIPEGIRTIVKRLKEYLWDYYENFLIRSIEGGKHNNWQKLDEYYRFIGAINIEPFAYNRDNNELLYSPDSDEYFKGRRCDNQLSIKYHNHYMKIKNSLSDDDKIQMFAVIFGRLKEINVKNVSMLNKQLSDLIGL